MCAKVIRGKVKMSSASPPRGMGIAQLEQNNPNYIIKDLTPQVYDKHIGDLILQVFDSYHTKGRDDTTFIKKEYDTSKDEVLPQIIRDIIEYSKGLCNTPPKDPRIVVKCYLYTKNTKTKIDIPNRNTAIRLLYNYSEDEKFYLDPRYEDVNMDGHKVVLKSDCPPSYVNMKKNTVFLMGPTYRYKYTIKDMTVGKDRSQVKKPRIGSYQRINVTVDFILKEDVILKLEQMSKEATASLKISAKGEKVDMNKHIELLKSKHPELKDLSEKTAKLLRGEDEDVDLIDEMKKAKRLSDKNFNLTDEKKEADHDSDDDDELIDEMKEIKKVKESIDEDKEVKETKID